MTPHVHAEAARVAGGCAICVCGACLLWGPRQLDGLGGCEWRQMPDHYLTADDPVLHEIATIVALFTERVRHPTYLNACEWADIPLLQQAAGLAAKGYSFAPAPCGTAYWCSVRGPAADGWYLRLEPRGLRAAISAVLEDSHD